MRSVRRTHTKLPAPAKKPSSKRNVRKLPPSGKKSSLKANIPRTTTPVNAALADPYLQLAIRTSASLKKQIKSGIEMDVAVGGSHTKNLVQHGFNRHEVEVILRTARLDHAKVQDLLKQYDTAVKKTSITAILDDVTEFNNRQSLSPDFLTKVEARAAKVIVNRVIDDPQRLHLNSEMPFYDEWKYLVTKWINHLYTREQVGQILKGAELRPTVVEKILDIYDKRKIELSSRLAAFNDLH